MKTLRAFLGTLTVLVSLVLHARAQSPLTNGLVAYYPLTGNVIDASGNGHDGVINGSYVSPTSNRFGQYDGALHFGYAINYLSGGDSYVSVSPIPFNVNSNWTISLWCVLDISGNPVDSFVSTGDDRSGGLNIRWVGIQVYPWQLLGNSPHPVPPGGPYVTLACAATNNPNVWNMLTCVRTGDSFQMFLNDSLVCSNSMAGQTLDNGSIWFGEHTAQNPYGLLGSLSDIRLYDRDLSPAEVQELYAYSSTHPPAFPHGAQATALIENGRVIGAMITDGGAGYTNLPTVQIIGGGGTGAQATAIVSNGIVMSLEMTSGGFGYSTPPLVVISPPFIRNPNLGIAPMTFLSFSNLVIGSSYQLQRFDLGYYWTNQPVSFTATNSVYGQLFDGVVDARNYRLARTPFPTQAFATPVVVNGFVVAVIVTNAGSGYTTPPIVTIVGGGSNAMAVAQISSGAVTSVSITEIGTGYASQTQPPPTTVQIAAPPVTAIRPTALPVMRVDAANLAPYEKYQIQFKSSLGVSWADWPGGLFTTTAATNSQLLFITNGVGFFRLEHEP